MIFNNISNTEVHIEFTDEEIKILSKHKRIILEEEHLKNFINDLGRIVNLLQIKLYKGDPKLANTPTLRNTHIKVK
jgi:Asp-tRNA(Asn)/Glu-tRNA(Gln) amidotransferase C subunit